MPRLAIIFSPAAKREAEHERRYYQREAARGEDFIRALRAAADRARRLPRSGARVTGPFDESVRAVRLVGFPFKLVYDLGAKSLVVIAIAHDARRPDYWHRRIKRR